MSTSEDNAKEEEKKIRSDWIRKTGAILGSVVGVLASLVAVIVFFTGKNSLQGLLPEKHTENLYQDDFSSPASGWDVSVDAISERYYEDGEYFVHILPSNVGMSNSDLSAVFRDCKNAWGIADSQNLADVAIDLDARYVGGSTQGAYGVIFNFQSKSGFYFFELTPDGYWDLVQHTDDDYKDLVNFQYSPAIFQGKSANHLRIELSDTVTLYINDQMISSVNLPRMRGKVGFWVTSWRGAEFEAAFDNLTISELP